MLDVKAHTSGPMFPMGVVHSLAFGRDGRRLVSGGTDEQIKVWSTERPQPRTFQLSDRTHGVSCLALDDGLRWIVSGARNGTLKTWDLAVGESTRNIEGHLQVVDCVAFDSKGTRIVSAGSDKTLKVWEAATGRELLALEGHNRAVTSLDFSPDGLRIVSGSWNGTVREWEAGLPR
jgi:WD40 repeat protein